MAAASLSHVAAKLARFPCLDAPCGCNVLCRALFALHHSSSQYPVALHHDPSSLSSREGFPEIICRSVLRCELAYATLHHMRLCSFTFEMRALEGCSGGFLFGTHLSGFYRERVEVECNVLKDCAWRCLLTTYMHLGLRGDPLASKTLFI